MDWDQRLKRSRKRHKRRDHAKASSSFKVMNLLGSSSHRSEPQPLSKACPPSWSIIPRTSLVHLNETQSSLKLNLVNSQFFQSSKPAKKLAKGKTTGLALPKTSTDFTQDQTQQETHENYETEEFRECPSSFVSPVVLLSRLHPRLRFSSVREKPHRGAVRSFMVVLQLEGRVFEGCGRSKGMAKARAAASALHALHGFSLRAGLRCGLRRDTKLQLPQLFAESIFGLVTEKYRELSLSSSSAHKGLCAIIITTGLDLRSAQVVAMSSGTKYVCMDSSKDDGLKVRDCHAEVLCRRALLCFFYDQLELLLWSPSEAVAQSIFVPTPGRVAMFRLRDDVHLHMFLSCPPCGDVRLHWPHPSTAHKSAEMTQRWRCGMRVKVTGAEGTLPLTTQCVQQQRASVSCTDKMAKWCVVGLQGSLLSHLVEPLYLHSVTIATHSHSSNMHRVMWQRLASVKRQQFPYRRRLFLLGCVGPCHLWAVGRGPNLSMNWTYGRGLEVINVKTGLQAKSEAPSQLCPHTMLLRWAQVFMQISGEDVSSRTCAELKCAAVSYQRALGHYKRGLQEAGLQ